MSAKKDPKSVAAPPRAGRESPRRAEPAPPPEKVDTAVQVPSVRFRPATRPPVPVLWILDDDQESGERMRIRAAVVVIGRTEGQVLLPHDTQVSSRHAEIVRRDDNGRCTWHLRDLSSTNGTFVKIARSRLNDGAEFRIGRQQFCFRLQPGSPPAKGGAVLVELSADGQEQTHAISGNELWIGRDPHCCDVSVKDPLVCPKHARIVVETQDRRYLIDGGSLNGTWLRIEELALTSGSEFEVGEQRFRFTIP
ncbi:MAG: FHA domain-containing protein [Planctomycetia bacterium]|nr:FHA domain-containing protein [Planctomycetia bacterium]